MNTNLFWRALAPFSIVVFVLSISSLCEPLRGCRAAFESAVYANGVAVSNVQLTYIYTSADNGQSVYVWKTDTQGKPVFFKLGSLLPTAEVNKRLKQIQENAK